ncbi:MAG: aminotransferase class V-fold PLP-dependent enzyme, partial [Myxococcota bacterium]
EMASEEVRVRALRDELQSRLLEAIPGTLVNGPEYRLYNNLNMSFPGVAADPLLAKARDIAASSGSACTSASLEPSHVLAAMGLSDDRVRAAVRFGLGRFSTLEDVDRAVESVSQAHGLLVG